MFGDPSKCAHAVFACFLFFRVFPGHLALLERVLDFLAEAAPEISGPDGVDLRYLEIFPRPGPDKQTRPGSARESEAEAEAEFPAI